MAHGLTDFSTWSKAMLAEEGSESLRPFLRMIFANSKRMLERTENILEDAPQQRHNIAAYAAENPAQMSRVRDVIAKTSILPVKDRFRIAAESLVGICIGGGLTWYTGRGTLHLLSAFWSHRFWSNIGSSFHGVFSSIGAITAFLFYVSIALAALFVTCMAIFITAFCLKRFFFGLAGREGK